MSKITQLHQIDLQSGDITNMRWSPHGRFLAVPTQSGEIPVFDIETGHIQTLGRHLEGVIAVAWDLKAEFIMTGSLDRSIGLWELKSGRRAPFTVEGHQTPVHSIEWTDEEAFAITCSRDRLRVLDGACLLSGWSKEMEDGINNSHTGFAAASCSRQTTFLLGIAAENGTLLCLVSLLSGILLSTLPMVQTIRSLAWSPKEDLLAVGTDRSILLFRCSQDGIDGPPHQLPPGASAVHALTFFCDGSLLASRDDTGLKIWDLKSSTLMASLDDAGSSGIAFHPARPLLATAASEQTVLRILDVSELV